MEFLNIKYYLIASVISYILYAIAKRTKWKWDDKFTEMLINIFSIKNLLKKFRPWKKD